MTSHGHRFLFSAENRLGSACLLLAALGLGAGWLSETSYAQENIDPNNDGSQYAFSENAGWINFEPAQGGGVTVSGAGLGGFAWAENLGWINLSPVFGGVINDGNGRLSGYAWGENVGWINFSPATGGVFIDQCGDFNGTAWGENIGWITFRASGGLPFKVSTSWVPPADVFAPTTSASYPALLWNNQNVTVTLTATDNVCGSGVREIHYLLDSEAEVITPGSTVQVEVTSEGVHTLQYFAVDQAGNAEPARLLTVRIDKTPPVITTSSPSDGGTYFINRVVASDYEAVDNLAGVASLRGTVPSGTPFDTSTAGSHLFTVEATDVAGNSATVTHVYTVIFPGNIDPGDAGSQYAYGENVGWINFQPSYGPGVTVTDSGLSGFAWGENIGWINLSPASGGVRNDGAGRLSGYAWGENVGWINFAPQGAGVTIDPHTGKFSGRAWGENIGWISFSSSGAFPFQLETSWRGQPPAGSPVLTALPSGANTILEWTALENTTGYDVVRGDLLTLHATGGDFTAATNACLANDLDALSLLIADSVPPGGGSWYLVRGINGVGPGTYDSLRPPQVGLRDSEIEASPFSCP